MFESLNLESLKLTRMATVKIRGYTCSHKIFSKFWNRKMAKGQDYGFTNLRLLLFCYRFTLFTFGWWWWRSWWWWWYILTNYKINNKQLTFQLRSWNPRWLPTKAINCSNKMVLPGTDVNKWKHFPRYWPFVRGIRRPPMNSPHKANNAELWCFLWSAPEPTVE